MAHKQLFPTSIIGSMPRPAFVRELIADDCPWSGDDYDRMIGAAIRSVVALQEAAGLDVVSDGEWSRKSYIGVIAELAHGFELSVNPADGRPWTIVVDRLAPKTPGFIAKEVSFLKQLTDRQVKATLPAPALLGERMWDPQLSSKAYPKREDFVRDCVPILRREIELLRDEGVSIIQVDDPHLCLFVDPEIRAGYSKPDQAADFAVDMDNEVVADFTDVSLAVHLCRRAGARARGEAEHQGSYDPIMSQLRKLNVGHITMEFTTPGSGEMSVLRQLPEHVEVGLGVVSTVPGQVDSVETIVGRVQKALEHIAPERIVLNPECGFAPGSGARVDIDEVYQKIKNEVAAAKVLREQFGSY
jgi:5-methyltetrahydropteroyltriglutamate--homocysteine methyltransferase